MSYTVQKAVCQLRTRQTIIIYVVHWIGLDIHVQHGNITWTNMWYTAAGWMDMELPVLVSHTFSEHCPYYTCSNEPEQFTVFVSQDAFYSLWGAA